MPRARFLVVVGLLLASLPAARGSSAAPSSGNELPSLYPVAQSVVLGTARVSIPGRVTVVADASTDTSALTVARQALRGAGADTILRGAPLGAIGTGLTIYLAAPGLAERSLGVRNSRGLPPGGYVLALGQVGSGRSVVVIDGVDHDGQYYAAQTLRQLFDGRQTMQAITIRDWPSLPLRGVVEGFYGTPWSQAMRRSMLDFLGAHKLNLYVWAPKDDPFLRARWRDPFPVDRHALIHALVTRAARDHVTFTVGISPGLSICYSSRADELRLIAKLAAAWAEGVRSFAVMFDDIDPDRPTCASDRTRFGAGPTALAAEQAFLLNRVAQDFVDSHPGPTPLIAVPTEYKGLETTPYRTTLARRLDPEVVVQWTGPYGISLAISGAEAAAARRLYGHPLLLWDNAFVNDFAPGSLILGAHRGTDAGLAAATLGITADPMDEAEASKLSLFTLADESWNLGAYDPSSSWQASIADFAGGIGQEGVRALEAFADVNSESPVSLAQSPELSAAVAAFWSDWNAGDAGAATRLKSLLGRLRAAPSTIRRTLHDPAFLAEAGPWLDATQAWAESASAAVDLLVDRRLNLPDQAATDEQKARELRTKADSFTTPTPSGPVPVKVAPGVFDRFVHQALRGFGP